MAGKVKDTESFIKRGNVVHGNKYDYSKAIYRTKRQKIIITCKVHGDFVQNAGNHLSGHGCKKCAIQKSQMSFDDFVKRSNKKHKNKYIYPKNFSSLKSKIKIICPEHGEFFQNAGNHLYGKGCKKCRIDSDRNSLDDFIRKSRIKHGLKYDYSLVKYKSSRHKVKIICPKHGIFEQLTKNHYKYGCEACAFSIGSVSIAETKWLNSLLVHEKYRQAEIKIQNKKYRVDAFNPNTNTIYEFYGDFWHGNPDVFDPEITHPLIKKKYKSLYQKTINREKLFKKSGYKVISIWENDFMRKSKTISLVPDKVKKPSGLKKDGTPNSSWRKFQERLDNYSSIPVSQWQADQVLGHLFYRYQNHFDINFSLSYSGPPSKCSEIYCTKRMMSLLGGENPDMKMVKAFIDWSFDSVIIPKRLQIESLAFFFSQKLVKEFKAKYKKANTITRATKLPTLVEQLAGDFGLDDSITTYGELAFAKKAVDADPENTSYQSYHDFFKSLSAEGFDYSVLQSLQG